MDERTQFWQGTISDLPAVNGYITSLVGRASWTEEICVWTDLEFLFDFAAAKVWLYLHIHPAFP